MTGVPHQTMTTADADKLAKALLAKEKAEGHQSLTQDEREALREAIVQRAANVTKPM